MSLDSVSNLLVILLVLANFQMLGTSRIGMCLRMAALQAVLLGVFPLLRQWGELTAEVVIVAAASMALKSAILPAMLARAMRAAEVRREVEPLVGFSLSLLAGIALLAASVVLGARLELPQPMASPFFVPVSLFTILTGLFVVVTRRKAITQVIGYLAVENGIYAFGLATAVRAPLLVELGTLLDIFVAVFVMGIAILHIRREFDHIDTDRLTMLKE
jgi:hydrogenase-4 component E